MESAPPKERTITVGIEAVLIRRPNDSGRDGHIVVHQKGDSRWFLLKPDGDIEIVDVSGGTTSWTLRSDSSSTLPEGLSSYVLQDPDEQLQVGSFDEYFNNCSLDAECFKRLIEEPFHRSPFMTPPTSMQTGATSKKKARAASIFALCDSKAGDGRMESDSLIKMMISGSPSTLRKMEKDTGQSQHSQA